MTMNPVSAITGARSTACSPIRWCARCARRRCAKAAPSARRSAAASTRPRGSSRDHRELGAFKTSMLQDVEAGRPIELDAIVGAVQEMGRRLDIATPTIDGLLGLTRLFAPSAQPVSRVVNAPAGASAARAKADVSRARTRQLLTGRHAALG
jgi:2-dehydropantoate 2-reductase